MQRAIGEEGGWGDLGAGRAVLRASELMQWCGQVACRDKLADCLHEAVHPAWCIRAEEYIGQGALAPCSCQGVPEGAGPRNAALYGFPILVWGSELLPQGHCGRHLPPGRSAVVFPFYS